MADEESFQGWEPVIGDGPDEAAVAKIIEIAFGYRGDVTLEMVDGTTIVGYLFNHQSGRTAVGRAPIAEVIQTATGERLRLPYDQIRAVRFSGRDMAAGQSYEAWQRRREAKAAEDRG